MADLDEESLVCRCGRESIAHAYDSHPDPGGVIRAVLQVRSRVDRDGKDVVRRQDRRIGIVERDAGPPRGEGETGETVDARGRGHRFFDGYSSEVLVGVWGAGEQRPVPSDACER